MDLRQKIVENCVEQIKLQIRMEGVRKEQAEIESEMKGVLGRMSAWSELYKDETGRVLENDMKSLPEWRGILEEAEQRAKSELAHELGSSSLQLVEDEDPVVEPEPQPELPRMKRVDGNRQVRQPEAQQAPANNEPVVTAAPSDTPPRHPKSTPNRREPIKMTIDDSPPSAPAGTPVNDLDDE